MSTTETTLHLILQAIIIDGFQRMRPETDIQSNAEAGARAFRAGLAAFTAPAEALVGSANASIAATVNYGGTKDAAIQQSTGGRFPSSPAAHIDRAAQEDVESMDRLAVQQHMAEKIAILAPHLSKVLEAEMALREQRRQRQL